MSKNRPQSPRFAIGSTYSLAGKFDADAAAKAVQTAACPLGLAGELSRFNKENM